MLVTALMINFASFHLKRLLNGATGTRIAMD
jgi:hypothetical protein